MHLRVQPNAVMAVGLSGILKEYAQKTEHVAAVRDGSTGELHEGYRLCGVTGAEVDGSEIVPPNQKLFSVAAKKFASEDAEVLAAVDPGAHPGLSGRAEKFRENSRKSKVLTVLLGASCRATHVAHFHLIGERLNMRVALLFSLCACLAVSNLSASGVIVYDLAVLGPHAYQYDYVLTGFPFLANQELDIRFDPTIFGTLSNATAGSGFSLVTLQPNNPPGTFGDYEIVALTDIASPSGPFSVDVSVPGSVQPGALPFLLNQLDANGNILYNVTAGSTVRDPAPEPASGRVVGMGLLVGVAWWAARRRLRSAVRRM